MTEFVIAITDRNTGRTGYLIQRYPGSDYSLCQMRSRIKDGTPIPLHGIDSATRFDGEAAVTMLEKIAERFTPNSEKWFIDPRIELADWSGVERPRS